MARSKKSGSERTPNQSMLRRILFLTIIFGVASFLMLAAKLLKLQIIDHEYYENLAVEQQLRETKLSAERGVIYDRNMNVLAMSASVETVYINPKYIYDNNEDINLIAENLGEILGVDPAKIIELAADTKSWYKTVKLKVEPEVSAKVREFIKSTEVRDEDGKLIKSAITGVLLEPDTKRYYPYSSLAAHVIGFVNIESNGASGVEASYNTELSGVPGRIVRAKNARGTDILFTKFEDYYDAQDGNDVILTLDANIQMYLQKHLEQAVLDYDCQNGAAAIAMDVKTGGILGLVSLGDFDLNNYQTVSLDAQEEIDAAETSEEKSALLNAAQQLQWRNKAIMDTYEPGSTFKIITLAMALEEGVVSETDGFYCGGSTPVIGRTSPVNCWKTAGHGSQTLTQAVQHSCNVAFVNIGLKIGEEKFYQYAEAFGFFSATGNKDAQLTGKTGIDLGGEAGSIWWPESTFIDSENYSQLAAASFGQTFNITPIQLITAIAACTNGGYLMKPYVVDEIRSPDGTVIEKNEPQVVRQVISNETSEKVNAILEQVVGDSKEGTGKNAYVAGYRIGGKTGTSTNTTIQAETGEKQYIVSFIGVAPMDDPQIAILVLLDSPSNETGIYISGGQMAAPTVGKIMADVLPYMGIEPVYDEGEEAILDKAVPNLKNLTVADAKAELAELGFTCRVVGLGEKVTGQLPGATATIAAGSEIILYCGEELPTDTKEMPDLSGMTYANARKYLNAMGLYIKTFSNRGLDSSSVRISQQSIASGTQVGQGTVVEVTLVDTSDVGFY